MISFQLRFKLASLVFMLAAFGASAQFSVTMPYKQVSVQSNNGTAVFSGASTSGEPGEPALPSYAVSFLLPIDADFSSLSVSIKNPVEQEMKNLFTVNPNPQLPGPDGKIIWPEGFVDGKNMAIYSKNAFFPANYRGSVQPGKMHQYNLVDIRIHPYQYNPVTKKLKMITGGVLSVNFRTGASSLNMERNIDVEKLLKQKVVNPSVFESYGTISAPINQATLQSVGASVTTLAAPASYTGTSYLIITSNQVKFNSTVLQTYCDFLNSKGFVARICTEDNWNVNNASYGQAKAENIRNYIRDYYMSHNVNQTSDPLHFVLLIGDPDTVHGDVPMKNYSGATDWEFYPVGVPTDHYYGDLSGDWNNGEIDVTAEAAVGRIPVYNNEYYNLDAYLNKVMSYATATKTEWRRTILAAAEAYDFNAADEGYNIGEDIINVLKPQGWSARRLYGAYSNLKKDLLPEIVDMNPLPDYIKVDPNVVARVWNSEAPGLVMLAGHGASVGTINLFQTEQVVEPFGWTIPENVSMFTNDYPAIVVAASCETSDPDYPNNAGTRLLYKSAIGYVGATTAARSPNSITKLFAVNIGENVTTGDALVNAKTLDNGTGDLARSTQFNLYGCPEVSLNLAPLSSITKAPQNFKATPVANTKQINLSWTASSGAASYVIERSNVHTGARINGFGKLKTCTGSTLQYSDVNLVLGTNYKYRIYAIDANGISSEYSPIDSAPCWDGVNNLSPAAPTNLSPIGVHSNYVKLSWAAASGAVSYNVKRSTSSSGPFVTIGNVTTTSFIDTNVNNDISYYYTASSVNSWDESANSNIVSTTLFNDLASPYIDYVGQLYNNQNTLITYIYWASGSGFNNELNYKIEYGPKMPDGEYGPFTSNITTPRGVFSYGASNIPYMPSLVIRMSSSNNSSSYSYFDAVPPTSFPLPRPAPPTNVALSQKPEEITVRWVHTTSPTPTDFEIFVKMEGEEWLKTYPNTRDSATLDYCIPNKKYYVCVRSLIKDDATGYTRYSEFTPIVTTTMTSAIAKPYELTAVATRRGTIELNWHDKSTIRTGNYIEQSSSGASGPFTQIANVNSSQLILPYLVTGLSDEKQYWFRVRAYNGSVVSEYSNVATDTTAPTSYQINCGSTVAADTFSKDMYGTGGTMRTVTNAINMDDVSSFIPQAVYQSERYGNSTYTFPNLKAGNNYAVRLHFAELYQTAAGKRVFKVAINGTTVLNNFDIYSLTGARYKAVMQSFNTTANSSGQVIVTFTNITDNATISGIEVIPIFPPVISSPAKADPAQVYTTSTYLSVEAYEKAENRYLTYTWTTTGTPPAPVDISPNGGYYSREVLANFTKAGNYTFLVTVRNQDNLTATSTVSVTVNQTLSGITLSPANVTLYTNASQKFTVTGYDQFGNVMTSQLPPVRWTIYGDITLTGDGIFTAGSTPSGPFPLIANCGGFSSTSNITIISQPATIYQINCGSTSAASPFTADQFVTGGTLRTVTNTITITGLTNPAPQKVYQSERYGISTYTLPNLTPGAKYKVRLHFAELYQTASGKRVFNVLINGATVLSNFDIYAAAGAAYKAVIREFTATANGSGQVIISFSKITDNPTIEGFELIRQ